MSEKSIASSWSDPDDAPKLTEEWAAGADVYQGVTLVRRGRPKLANPKQHVSLRLDHDVVASFKALGAGWQSKVNEVLRQAASARGFSATGSSAFAKVASGGSYMTTSKSDASKASKILRGGKSSKAERSVAASDLSQAKKGGSKKK